MTPAPGRAGRPAVGAVARHARLVEALALTGILAVTSSYVVGNLGGPVFLVLYPVVVLAVLLVGWPAASAAVARAPAWVLPALVAVVVVVLVVGFVVGVPGALRPAFGAGTDRAEALDIVLTRLTHGLYPYAAVTSVGNPISPLPGSFVLAAPFWWLTGNAGRQNVAWTLLLLPVLNGGLRPAARPTVLWALAVLGGMEVLREYLVGDDLVTSVVPALAVTAWLLRAARSSSGGVLVLAGVVLGVTTCTRPDLVLVLVIVAAAVGARAGWRRGVVVGGVAALTWVVLITPFLLGGIHRFSPLHVAAKVTGDRAITVGIVAVAVLALGVVVGLLAWLRPTSPRAVGWLCAAVLFAPSPLSWVHAVVTGAWGELDLTLGAGAVPFALWGALAGAAPSPRDRDGTSIGHTPSASAAPQGAAPLP